MHLWGLPIALDLFFAGLGASLFLVAVMADLCGGDRYTEVRRVGGILAPWPVLLGVLLLVLDLGNPLRFWEFVLRAGPGLLMYNPGSVMSTGVWLLIIFSIISLGYFVLSLIRGGKALRRMIGVAGLPFGLLVTIYTGVLLAGTSIPLWDTALLPVLFVVSALLAGLAAIIFFLGLRPTVGIAPIEESKMQTLIKGQTWLAVLVLVFSLIYVSVKPGASSPMWWVLVVIAGLAVPILFGFARSKVQAALAIPAVAFLIMLGAFFLRYTILMNGQV